MAKKKSRARPPRNSIDEDWNQKHGAGAEKGGSEWKAANKLCDEICQSIEDASESVWDKAFEFFESVSEKVANMQETIVKNKHVTTRQLDALNNMKRGVDKWLGE